MKQYFILIIVGLGISTASLAQKEDGEGKIVNPPQPAKMALLKAFPGSSHVKWEKEDGNYEAGFEQNGKKMSAVFDSNGSILETETEMKPGELPAAVLQYVKDHYRGAVIKEAAKITSAKGEVTYEAEVNTIDLIFDVDGKFLKEEKD